VSNRRRQRRLLAFTVLWGCVLATVGSVAEGACPIPTPTYPFAPWGDTTPYVLAKDGSFEDKSPWRGTATRVPENNPFQLAGPGQRSMRVQGDQVLVSPVLCVNDKRPYLRFVARALDPESWLVVEVLWKERGEEMELVLDEHSAALYQVWGPSNFVPLATAMTLDKKKENVRLRFTLKGGVGDWLVDDVFVDPIKRS
jgi:hypothetical protein